MKLPKLSIPSLVAFAVVLATLAWAAPVAAQTAGTGAMIARTVDPDGLALPGATVHLEGPLGTNTQVTAVDGNARILGLVPGDYTVTFSLSGFKTIVREGLRITVGRTVSVTVNMELSAVEETITVTGETPVVDIKHATVGSLYTDDLINMTPTASGIWAGVLDHVPGVITNSYDVGGGESGQQAGFRAYGSVGSQNQYKINGIPTTDPVATSSSAMAYVNIGSFEEIAVETASHDVEMQGPGVMMNMVVKSGSNDWHGGVKFFYENDAMVSTNVSDEQEEAGVGEGNPNTLLSDLSLQLGGPIWRDRAWFFVDYWKFTTERLVVGVPSTDPDDTHLTDLTINTTIQATDNNKLNVRYLNGDKFRSQRGASATEDPARARNQKSFKYVPQVQWQSVLGASTFLDVSVAYLDLDFPLQARNPAGAVGVPGREAAPEPHPNFLDVPYTDDQFDTGLLNTTFPNDDQIGWPGESLNLRDRFDLGGSITHYLAGETQSHDLKFGSKYGTFWEHRPTNTAFGMRQYYRTVGGVPLTPARVRLYNVDPFDMFQIEPPYGEQNRGSEISIFGQDTFTYNNRLTVTFGLRWDRSTSWFPDQKRAASYWADSVDPTVGTPADTPADLFKEADIPGLDQASLWSNIVPRLSVVYDLMGDGRTALKAGYARYSEWQGVTWAASQNPNGVSNIYYNWSDTNGDGRFQAGEQTSYRSRSIAGVSWEYDPELNSPLTDEVTVGFEHEVLDGILLSANYIWRDRKNGIEEINIGEPYGPIAETLGVESRYFPVEVIDPGLDGVLGNADDGGPITIWGHPSDFDNQFYVTNPIKFGLEQKWGYNGLEIVLQKRWSNNWQVLASYNYGVSRIYDDVGDNPNQDINANGVISSYDRPHMFRVTGNYLIAEPIGVNIGMFWKMYSGQGRIRSVRYYDNDYPELEQGDVTIRQFARREDEIGPKAYDFFNMLDLRAEKQVTIGNYGVLHFYFDVFNVFNINSVTSGNSTVLNPAYSTNRYYWEDGNQIIGTINNIIPPRVIRIGGAWDF